jgi:hypothetical protein
MSENFGIVLPCYRIVRKGVSQDKHRTGKTATERFSGAIVVDKGRLEIARWVGPLCYTSIGMSGFKTV